jgi:hypothetical protein
MVRRSERPATKSQAMAREERRRERPLRRTDSSAAAQAGQSHATVTARETAGPAAGRKRRRAATGGNLKLCSSLRFSLNYPRLWNRCRLGNNPRSGSLTCVLQRTGFGSYRARQKTLPRQPRRQEKRVLTSDVLGRSGNVYPTASPFPNTGSAVERNLSRVSPRTGAPPVLFHAYATITPVLCPEHDLSFIDIT